MGIYKSYDVRGVYPSELNEETAYKIGKAFVDFVKAKKVVVGRDMRLSSETIFDALAKGITEQGADVVDIGLCTSPMLSFAVAFYEEPSGIMITASHNPKEYNGFKMCGENSEPIGYDDGINVIEKNVKEGKFNASKKKGKIVKKEILKDYLKFVLKFAKGIKPLKVVIDAGNGMASLDAPEFFSQLPCKTTKLFFGMDGSFPNHEANPLKEENLEELKKKVVAEKADLGIAFDGDADRVGFVDDKGKAVPNDIVTAIIANELLKEKPNSKIVYDLRSTKAVKEIIEENKGIPLINRVGHVHLKKRLKTENAIFGGELSGHYFFKDFFNCDNAMIAAIIILNIISRGEKLSALVKSMTRYAASPEINFEVHDKDKAIKKIEAEFKEGKKSYIDGVTIEFDDWWFNLRASNTEPLLRLRIEAKNKKMLGEKTKLLEKLLKE